LTVSRLPSAATLLNGVLLAHVRSTTAVAFWAQWITVVDLAELRRSANVRLAGTRRCSSTGAVAFRVNAGQTPDDQVRSPPVGGASNRPRTWPQPRVSPGDHRDLLPQPDPPSRGTPTSLTPKHARPSLILLLGRIIPAVGLYTMFSTAISPTPGFSDGPARTPSLAARAVTKYAPQLADRHRLMHERRDRPNAQPGGVHPSSIPGDGVFVHDHYTKPLRRLVGPTTPAAARAAWKRSSTKPEHTWRKPGRRRPLIWDNRLLSALGVRRHRRAPAGPSTSHMDKKKKQTKKKKTRRTNPPLPQHNPKHPSPPPPPPPLPPISEPHQPSHKKKKHRRRGTPQFTVTSPPGS